MKTMVKSGGPEA